MTIDEMYELRKWTKSSRRFWGQRRPGKHIEGRDFNATSEIPSKLRLRMCLNLFSLLFILAVAVVAAIGYANIT